MDRLYQKAEAAIQLLPDHEFHGKVTKILGLLVEIAGFGNELSIGSIVHLRPKPDKDIPCEVVGFREHRALLMPFGTLEGVGLGCRAVIQDTQPVILPDESWLGRVINALGEPVDGKGPLKLGGHPIPLKNKAPNAHERTRVGRKIDLGVRSINSFTPICQGQRMGIFAGSGVGKSVLLSMMARYMESDVAVIGLVGERGREVQEFLEDDLGPEGLARSVVIVATGDEPALMRRQAAYMTMAVAEYFREQNKQVLCLIDSITRFAMAQREIGLSAGEPPTTKGYPPTTFGELARLLERAGPGLKGEGAITGVFSVLVEGDDHNEPVADAVRGIVDGHIVMERAIADRGRYPAINVTKSVSRSLPHCFDDMQNETLRRSKQVLTAYEDMAELIRLGAYRKGTDPAVDEAIRLYPDIEEFLRQNKDEKTSIDEGFVRLNNILGGPSEGDDNNNAGPAGNASPASNSPNRAPNNAPNNAGLNPPPNRIRTSTTKR
jgi:flagellum-specific ATP synthase